MIIITITTTIIITITIIRIIMMIIMIMVIISIVITIILTTIIMITIIQMIKSHRQLLVLAAAVAGPLVDRRLGPGSGSDRGVYSSPGIFFSTVDVP